MAVATPLLDSLPAERSGPLPDAALPSLISAETAPARPTTPAKARRSQGFLVQSVIDGYHQLGRTLHETAHQIVMSPQEAIQAGAPHASLSGRLQSIGAEVGAKMMGNRATPKQVILSALDSGWMPGRLYMEKEAINAHDEREYSVFGGMRPDEETDEKDEGGFDFAVFELNPNVPHLLSRQHPNIYGQPGMGDWELRDFVSSNDASPTTGHYKLLEGINGDVPIFRYGLLSDIDVQRSHQAALKERYGLGYKNELDKFMMAFYQQYVEGKRPQVTTGTRDLMAEYKLHCPNVFDWRIPARGWAKMLELADFKKNYRKKFNRHMPLDTRHQIEIQQDRVRMEVIQALAMSQLNHELDEKTEEMAIMLGGSRDALPDPVAWRLRGVDQFDYQFTGRLQRAYQNPRDIDEVGEAQEVGAIAAINAQLLGAQANLAIEPTRGNGLIIDGQGFDSIFAYNETQGWKPEQGSGTPDEIVTSFYDTYQVRGKPMIMGGVVCHLAARGHPGEDGKEFLIFDVRKGHAGVVRYLDERLDIFKSAKGIPRGHFLASMLLDKPKKDSITVVETSPTGKHTVKKEILPDKSSIATYDPDKRETVFHNAKNVRLKKAVRKNKNVKAPRRGSKESRNIRRRYAVVPEKPIPKNHLIITGMALQNRAAFVRDGRGSQSMIMPNPNPTHIPRRRGGRGLPARTRASRGRGRHRR
jgi:hypothetical protein